MKSHQKQVDAGRMAPLDVKQAEAAVASSDAALFAARNQAMKMRMAGAMRMKCAWEETRPKRTPMAMG
ncbi:MAG: hypothetical protein AAF585_02290 [Verrucomicrobiota bacterium]